MGRNFSPGSSRPRASGQRCRARSIWSSSTLNSSLLSCSRRRRLRSCAPATIAVMGTPAPAWSGKPASHDYPRGLTSLATSFRVTSSASARLICPLSMPTASRQPNYAHRRPPPQRGHQARTRPRTAPPAACSAGSRRACSRLASTISRDDIIAVIGANVLVIRPQPAEARPAFQASGSSLGQQAAVPTIAGACDRQAIRRCNFESLTLSSICISLRKARRTTAAPKPWREETA